MGAKDLKDFLPVALTSRFRKVHWKKVIKRELHLMVSERLDPL